MFTLMILCRIGVVTYKETEKNDKDVINYSIFHLVCRKIEQYRLRDIAQH